MAEAGMAAELIKVVTLLGAAVIAVPIFRKIGLGSVLGYLAGGLLIGPFGLGIFTDPNTIIHVAELGVVMFLFIIGLEMQPAHLWGLRRQIFGLGSLQVLGATTLMTAVIMLFGASWQVAFIGAAGFVLTSTAIVMTSLGENNELSTPKGQSMVSILLFEDLLIVPLLAIVAFLAPVVQTSDTPAWQSILIAIGSLLALFFAGRVLINPLFKILAKTGVREIMTAAALLVVLGSALLMELGGLSMAMGAFVAGVLLSESSFRHQLEADIEPFRGLLLGLFFLGVGMALDLSVVADNWQLISLGVLALMATKGVWIYLVARTTKSDHAIALERAVMMAQGGEFAFVLFSAAAAQSVIDATTHANLTAIVVMSMVLTPLFLVIHGKFAKTADRTTARENDFIDEENPIIILGHGRYGQVVNGVLTACGYHTTLIDSDADHVDGLANLGIKTYFGDATRFDLLEMAGIAKAKLAMITIDDPQKSLSIVKHLRHDFPDLPIVARAYDRIHAYQLHRAGANAVIRETFDSAVRSAKTGLELLGMDSDTAERIAHLYHHRDRDGVAKAAESYDPDISRYKNTHMISLLTEHRADTKVMIDKLMRGEEIEWQPKRGTYLP
ncbi:monovalent cation:proton antiporter-2 (CPA2) family protein [Moraxella sp. FZLJ2107]|uniref:monovalent cation:proton antiporter-2 (CPA2) family protein n=1 Tax=unclassified Moraxella TaxID=2685852 RepID=UPI0020C91CB9|nr:MULTISPECIES: monovalent cation:proton antiporter-2 (CPA2) family protein [unclassified Moraxella]UTO05251.1 monovalent cation:proton antiporter-2 (CPA2) family protein [Moraxella sp. FZLJ2107]UTO21986.1 monovalent cation:proton antiporter-2 (CPA2) family protein [Moraxella sp. FZLJ2109]